MNRDTIFPIREQDIVFDTPHNLTSNNTIGVSEIATFGDAQVETNYPPYKMFDNSTDFSINHTASTNPSTSNHGILGWWTRDKLKVSSIKVTNTTYTNSYQLHTGKIQVSNNTSDGINGTWTDLTTYSNPSQTAGAEWYIPIPENKQGYYQAYRFYMDTGYNYQRIGELNIVGTYRGVPEIAEYSWAAPCKHKWCIRY